jgi:hypothetical protein
VVDDLAGATPYDSMPKALPGPATDPETHERVRHDVDRAGSVTLRYNGWLHHIGVDEPMPEPASSCSSRTSTPPPANSCEN